MDSDQKKNAKVYLYAGRPTLAARKPKKIDMEEVYRLLAEGKSISSVAAELGVSRGTLYNRHKKFLAEREGEANEGLSLLRTAVSWKKRKETEAH